MRPDQKQRGGGAPALGAALVAAALSAGCAHAGADGAPGAAPDPEVLAVREAAWRAYFGGDVEALRAVLPPEFIGIAMNEGPFADLAETLEGSRSFHARGGRLVRLEFPETRMQRLGDVAVLYGRYVLVLESGGAERTLQGRLTELFVRRGGRWLHPGWHLDLTGGPPAADGRR
jgi:hypothetical protein